MTLKWDHILLGFRNTLFGGPNYFSGGGDKLLKWANFFKVRGQIYLRETSKKFKIISFICTTLKVFLFHFRMAFKTIFCPQHTHFYAMVN